MKGLNLVTEGAVPCCNQIKEQIRWQIATGELNPGDQLPSVREMSDCLGVARNTMITVYDELRAEGLLHVGRGRATEVADGDAVVKLRPLAGLLTILDNAFETALAQGFSPAEIRNAAQTRVQLLAASAALFSGVTVVDSTLQEFSHYADQIKQVVGGAVRGIDLGHLQKHPLLAGERVLAPCYSAEAVRQVVTPETEVIALGFRLSMRDLMAMMQLEPATSALVVGNTLRSAEWARAEAVREGAPATLQAVGLQEPEALERLQRAGALFAFPSAYDEVRRAVPEAIPVRALEITLDTGTQERLKAVAQRIAT